MYLVCPPRNPNRHVSHGRVLAPRTPFGRVLEEDVIDGGLRPRGGARGAARIAAGVVDLLPMRVPFGADASISIAVAVAISSPPVARELTPCDSSAGSSPSASLIVYSPR